MQVADDQNTSLFHLSLDTESRSHMAEAAKWARFLAIVGMIFLGLALVTVLFFSYYIGSLYTSGNSTQSRGLDGAGYGVGIAIFYMLILGVWFFPLVYLLRFSKKMRTALNSNDQQALELSFQNLKACFRFVGIVTIIVLAIYVVGIIIGFVTFAAFA